MYPCQTPIVVLKSCLMSSFVRTRLLASLYSALVTFMMSVLTLKCLLICHKLSCQVQSVLWLNKQKYNICYTYIPHKIYHHRWRLLHAKCKQMILNYYICLLSLKCIAGNVLITIFLFCYLWSFCSFLTPWITIIAYKYWSLGSISRFSQSAAHFDTGTAVWQWLVCLPVSQAVRCLKQLLRQIFFFTDLACQVDPAKDVYHKILGRQVSWYWLHQQMSGKWSKNMVPQPCTREPR